MTFIIVVMVLLLAAFSLSYLIQSSLLISLPTAIFALTAVLYCFALFDLLWIGFWVVLATVALATAACLIPLIRKKELATHLRSMLSPGLAIFLLLALFSFFLTRGLQLSSWDEFSHWGTIVRATFLHDAVGPYNPVDLMFRSYPPSLSLFEYFVTKLGGSWLEGNIFWAYQLIIWSLFTPFLAQLAWRDWGKLFAIIPLVFIAPLAFFNSLNVTLIDPLLGMLFGYALAISYLGSILNWRLALHLGLAVFMLALAKDVGLFMATAVLVLYVSRLFAARKLSPNDWSWRSVFFLAFFPSLSLVASNQTWAALVREKVESPAFQGPIDISAFFGALRGGGPAYWQEILSTFSFGLNNYPVNNEGALPLPQVALLFMFVILIGALEWIVSRRMGRRFGFAALGVVIASAVVYTFGLLLLYLFRFGEWEAVRLASYERYLGTYWAGITLFIALVTIWLVAGNRDSPRSNSKSLRGLSDLLLAGALAFSMILLTPMQKLYEFFSNPNSLSSQVRSQFQPTIELAKSSGLNEGDSVWIISQYSNGFSYWVLRYLLLENRVNPAGWSLGVPSEEADIWTIPKKSDEWGSDLKDYDYVLIDSVSESFREEYGVLFPNPKDLVAPTLLKVNLLGDSVTLTKAP
jgi:hypothetical protein